MYNLHLNCSVLTFGSTAEQSDSKQSSTLTESSGKSLSHEEYLVSVGKELGFSNSDIKFAVALYNTVSSGKFGITRESLRTHTSLSGLEHQLSFDEHIQTLVNFELVRLKISCIHGAVTDAYHYLAFFRYIVLESTKNNWCPIPIPISGA